VVDQQLRQGGLQLAHPGVRGPGVGEMDRLHPSNPSSRISVLKMGFDKAKWHATRASDQVRFFSAAIRTV
jgi:hypothetical protein